MFCKDMPNFNGELLRWLIAYKIEKEKGTLPEAYKEVINLVKIDATKFMDIIDEMILSGCVVKNTKPVYALKQKSKNVHKITHYDHFYLLTQKGKKQLCFGWKFASSAIPQELFEEVLDKIPFIER